MTNGQKLTLPPLPLFEKLLSHPKDKVAVIHSKSQRKFTYGSLVSDIARGRARMLSLPTLSSGGDLEGRRVCFLVENGYDYVGMWFIMIYD